MARPCAPYHSVDSDVYHIYSDCTVGNNIERDKKDKVLVVKDFVQFAKI